MKKKNALSLAVRVSMEDALRLENLMMRMDLIKAEFAQKFSDAAQKLDAAKADIWPRYRLGATDEVNLETGAITRAVA